MTSGMFSILSQDKDTLELARTLGEGDSVFAGHFPELPIVPGVLQVDWAMQHSQHWYSSEDFWRLDKLKFQQVIMPGDDLILRLENVGKGRVSFAYHCDDKLMSSGYLVFRV